MKHWLLGLALALALPAQAALDAGEPAPVFVLPAALAGKAFQFDLEQALKQGPVVVYFYPSAYTEGCNVQAREFSVRAQEFAAAGAQVVGVSLDDLSRLEEFSRDPNFCAGKLAVASDAQGTVARAYGLDVAPPAKGKLDTRGDTIAHGFVERTTFIVNRDGSIAAVISGIAPKANVKQALAIVTALKPSTARPN